MITRPGLLLVTQLMLIACSPRLTYAWMPFQSLHLGSLTPEQVKQVQQLWTQVFFTVPESEFSYLFQAQKPPSQTPSGPGHNTLNEHDQPPRPGEDAAEDGESKDKIQDMRVDEITEDDLLWDVYAKEVTLPLMVENELERGGGYPRINTQHLQRMLETVFQNTRSDETDAKMKNAVRMYITRKFYTYNMLSMGHVFRFQPVDLREFPLFQENNTNSSVVDVVSTEPIGVNVVGIMPGRRWGTSADRLLIVGAHYDTVPNTPGYDDNGSGVAAMLEAARTLALSGCHSEFSIVFVAFDLEEIGAAGSMAFIHEFLNTRILAPSGWPPVQGAYILDTILNFDGAKDAQTVPEIFTKQFPDTISSIDAHDGRGDFLALMYRRDVDQHLAEAYRYHFHRLGGEGRFRMERFPADLPAARPSDDVLYQHMELLRSDHSRFWYVSRGVNQTEAPSTIPAVLLTDTGPFRGLMAQCYHAECDDADHLATADSLHFLAHSTQALVNTLVDLSSATCTGKPLEGMPPPLLPPRGRPGKQQWQDPAVRQWLGLREGKSEEGSERERG